MSIKEEKLIDLLNLYRTNRDKITHERYRKGYDLEFTVYLVLRVLGFITEHPVLDVSKWISSVRKSVDFILKEKKVLIEVKNWEFLLGKDKYISPKKIETEILERFIKTDPSHEYRWILVITKRKFSKEGERLIKKHNISVVEIGFIVSPDNQGKAFKKLKNELSHLL